MSHETDRNVDDVGPGVMEALDQSPGEKIQGYVIGLAIAVLLTAAARILLVKGFNRELAFTFSDYKKFQVDSRVVAVADQP